jgi:glucokinase
MSVGRVTAADPAPASPDLLVGVDVGGSKVAVIVVDTADTVLGRTTLPTPVGEPADAAALIASAIEEALASTRVGLERVAAVGVGVPGRVDPDEGVVSLAVNLGWHRLPLRAHLEARLGVPCAIENDVRAAAAGILERSLLGPVADFVYLSVGTGISAGVVLGGRVHRGIRGLAGEIGHIVVDVDGPQCPCGLRGCLETVSAGPAIARAARSAGFGEAGTEPLPRDVYAAAVGGDQVARAIVHRSGRALARAIHALVMTYDVERVVIGGGVTGAGDAFLDPILAELDEMRAVSELAAEMLPVELVMVSPDGVDAGARGGVSIARGLAAGSRSAGVEPDRLDRPTASEEVVARAVGS